MPSRLESRGIIIVGEMPKGGELEGRGGGGVMRLPMWLLAVPYGEEAASSLSEMVVLVLGIRIFL
jgi:hypothetical protein